MKKSAVLTVVMLSFLIIYTPLSSKNEHYVNLYNELKEIEIDKSKIGEIDDVTITRDVATLHLAHGTLYFFKPVVHKDKEHRTGAIFYGAGTFSFTPPTRIEKEQIVRFYKTESFEENFTTLYLRFTDSTYAELAKHITFKQAPISKKIEDAIEFCQKFITEKRNENIVYDILFSVDRNPTPGYFYAHIETDREGPVFFSYEPYSREGIEFAKRCVRYSYVKETINLFDSEYEHKEEENSDKERSYFFVPTHYRINATIESNASFSATSRVNIELKTDSTSIIKFYLAPELTVSEVVDRDDSSLSFIKEKDGSDLIVFFDKPLTKGEKQTIEVTYEGDVLKKHYGNYYIKSNSFWYPRSAMDKRATYDLTFRTPEQYKFCSIGKKIEEKKENGYLVTRWIQETPVLFAAFNLGPFKQYDMEIEGAPPITVFMSEALRNKIAMYLLEHHGIARGKNMEKQVGADIANSIQLFSQLYGEFPFEKLYVTETPFAGGISFPGLLHLKWSTFQITDDWGEQEIFRAHEVAHQWWGNTVGCETYHDKWLAEGLAQYSGLWYMQWIKKDNDRFFQILDEWKTDIISNRKYIFGSGAEAGPIWLGYRTSSSETVGDYSLIVYKKGAYVFHMLRNILIDLKTMNEDKFKNMMQDFYQTYKWKNASTQDFKKIVDKHCEEDMEWFFKQWIYETDIPTYRVSYRSFEKGKGKYILKLRVRQEGVPHNFKMYVPITIQFKNKQRALIRLSIDKPYKEFSIPSPLQVDKIIFNDFDSVLAQVKYERFEE